MIKNIGSKDAVFRLVAGAVLLALPYLLSFDSAAVAIGSVAVGTVLMITAVFGVCPLYTVFGIRTCRAPK